MNRFYILYYDKNSTSTDNQCCTIFADLSLQAEVMFRYTMPKSCEIITTFKD